MKLFRHAIRATSALAVACAAGVALAMPPGGPDVSLDLVAGGWSEDGSALLAGVELRLDEGWKTYWRHPGDSGIPPSFDFSDSSNVADVEILWPAPGVFDDGYGSIVGYAREVVFPLEVTPDDPDLPVELVLRLDYGVCAEICVPMSGDAQMALGEDADGRGAIEAYLARLPVAADGTDAGVVGLEVIGGGEGASELEIVARFPEGSADRHLIVEAPEDWYLPMPRFRGLGPDGLARFTVPLDGAPAGSARQGIALRVTGIAGDFAFEQRVTLD